MLVSRLLSAVLLLAVAIAPASAQCDLLWQPGAPAGGPQGTVNALLRLPNGNLVAGGSFLVADGALANNIAEWDGTAWRALGAGVNGPVTCLARLQNGMIVAGGNFTTAGGLPASRIAAWNGASWAPLGTGLSSIVYALLTLPNGDLVAGGVFSTAGGQPVGRIARWNGFAWSSFAGGFSLGEVNALALAPNGDLLAGGTVTLGSSTVPLARWTGAGWSAVPGFGATSSAVIREMARRSNGEVVCGGSFFLQSGQANLVRWDGTTVQALPSPLDGSIGALLTTANGDLVAGVYLEPPVSNPPTIARWDGAAWTPIANSPNRVTALAEDASGALLAGRAPVNTADARAVRRYDGLGWQPLGAPLPPKVTAMVRLTNGDVVVAGDFASIGGVAANRVARWNGSAWSPLGLGVDGPVTALAAAPDGAVVVGGTFTNAGGAPAANVARFDGATWSTLGAGLTVEPRQLAVATGGDVFCATISTLHRFDGATWSTVTLSAGTVSIQSLAALPNGDLSIAGVFPGVLGQPGLSGLLRYQSGTVSLFPNAPGVVFFQQFVTDSGALVTRSNTGLWRWDGAAWSQLPTLTFAGIAEFPNGDLIACGDGQSQGGAPASAVYRLKNGAWQSIGSVVGNGSVVAASGHGDVLVAGNLISAAGQVSVGLARARPTCPAVATTFGAGCVGSAGPVTLTPDNLPWAGGVYRATATGMPPGSLAVQLFGNTPATLVLPGSAPGCALFVDPFLTGVVSPAGGLAAASYALPNAPVLFGQPVRHQIVGVEQVFAGNLLLTTSNALDLTIGGL